MHLKKQKNNIKIMILVALMMLMGGGLAGFFGANKNKVIAMEKNDSKQKEEKTEEKFDELYDFNDDAYKYIDEVVSKMDDESNEGKDEKSGEVKEHEENIQYNNEYNSENNSAYEKEELKKEIDEKMMGEINKINQANNAQISEYEKIIQRINEANKILDNNTLKKEEFDQYKHLLEEIIANLESDVSACMDDDTKELLDALHSKVEEKFSIVNDKLEVEEKELADLETEFDEFKQSFQDGLARLASKINSLLGGGGECQTSSIDDIEAAINDVYDNGYDSGYSIGYEEAYDYGYEAGKNYARTQSIKSTKINVNHGQYWVGVDSNGTYDFSGIKNVTWKVSGWCNESEEDGETYTSFWVMLNDEFVLNSSNIIDLCGSVNDGVSYKEITGNWNVNGNSSFNVKLSYNSAIDGGGATFEIVSIEYF